MNKYLTIIDNDLRNTRRDPTLILLLWVPILILALIRFGLPKLFVLVPQLSEFVLPFISLMAAMSAIFPSFILSFMLLDEKDDHLLPAIKVSPVSLMGYLRVRVNFMAFLGFLFTLILLLFNGIYPFKPVQATAIAGLCALNAPFFSLAISSLARNKIEGMTLLKVANFILIIPATIFLFHSPLEYLLGIFPAFWVYEAIKNLQNSFTFWMVVVIGIGIISIINHFLIQWCVKRLSES